MLVGISVKSIKVKKKLDLILFNKTGLHTMKKKCIKVAGRWQCSLLCKLSDGLALLGGCSSKERGKVGTALPASRPELSLGQRP